MIEDLHWSDRATATLTFLVRAARHEPIALVVTSTGLTTSPVILPHWRSCTSSSGAAGGTVDVDRFGHAKVHEQVASIRNKAPDPALIDRLVDRAKGNAFFTEELLAADANRDALPESLRQTLLLRFAGCSDDVSQVIHTVAVAGREIEHELLETNVPLGDQRLTAALREAVDGQILVHPRGSTRVLRSGTRCCRGRLLRPVARRASADARDDRRSDPAATGARGNAGGRRIDGRASLARGRESTAALTASIDAALAAERIYASGEALAHYRRALALWDEAAPATVAPALDRVAALRGAADAAAAWATASAPSSWTARRWRASETPTP